MADGRTLPRNFRQFTHGYAVTAHRSQGKSVDSVIISADRMKQELFYVAASRGRKSALVVTSDKQMLRESVACLSARQSASELARKVKPLHRGISRGLGAARRMARRAAQYVFSRFRIESPTQDLEYKPQVKPQMQTETKLGMETGIAKKAEREIKRGREYDDGLGR